jgi:MerR family redox-sensitive transcriptional activator SoxR
MLTIGQLAKEAGLNASAIRYYERNGLLPQPERRSGQRRYEREDTLRRLQVIDIAQRAGFSLDEIKRLDDPGDLRALAERKLPDVEALIARAQAMRDWLVLARECECSSLELCALFDACSPSQAEKSSAGSGRLIR